MRNMNIFVFNLLVQRYLRAKHDMHLQASRGTGPQPLLATPGAEGFVGFGGATGAAPSRPAQLPMARPLAAQTGGMPPRPPSLTPPRQAPQVDFALADLQAAVAAAAMQQQTALQQQQAALQQQTAALTGAGGAEMQGMQAALPPRSVSPRWPPVQAAPGQAPARSGSAPGSPAAHVLTPPAAGSAFTGFSCGAGAGDTGNTASTQSSAATAIAGPAGLAGLADTAAQRSPRPPIGPRPAVPAPSNAPRAQGMGFRVQQHTEGYRVPLAAPGRWGGAGGAGAAAAPPAPPPAQPLMSAFANASQPSGGAFDSAPASPPMALPADFGPADRVPSVSGPLASFPDLASLLGPGGDILGLDAQSPPGPAPSADLFAGWGPASAAPPSPTLPWPAPGAQGAAGSPALQAAGAQQGQQNGQGQQGFQGQQQQAAALQGLYRELMEQPERPGSAGASDLPSLGRA